MQRELRIHVQHAAIAPDPPPRSKTLMCRAPLSTQVTLEEIVSYMRGPLAAGEDSGDEPSSAEPDPREPALPVDLRVNIPALDSKVGRVFRKYRRRVVLTPPYCPKSQPIKLMWGVGKQRAGTLYEVGRGKMATRRHLRRGWYGGKGKSTARFAACNVKGCWQTAEREMNAWIAQDKKYTAGRGVEGKLGGLLGAERWTSTGPGGTFIEDMEEAGGFFEDTEEAEREHEEGGYPKKSRPRRLSWVATTTRQKRWLDF